MLRRPEIWLCPDLLLRHITSWSAPAERQHQNGREIRSLSHIRRMQNGWSKVMPAEAKKQSHHLSSSTSLMSYHGQLPTAHLVCPAQWVLKHLASSLTVANINQFWVPEGLQETSTIPGIPHVSMFCTCSLVRTCTRTRKGCTRRPPTRQPARRMSAD